MTQDRTTPLVSESEKREEGESVRIGVVGAGSIVKAAIPAFQSVSGVSITAISGRTRERAERVAEQFEIPSLNTDYRDLIARDDVDLVYVATPPRSHYGIVCDVLAAGKHVLCEKQFAMTSDEAADMAKRATDAGVVNAITHPARFLPSCIRARQLVSDGFIGQPVLVRVQALADYALRSNMPPYWVSWASSRAEGGGLRDYLCHHLDLVRYLFGDLEMTASLTLIAKKSRAVPPPGMEIAAIPDSAVHDAPSVPADAYDTAVVQGVIPGGGLVGVTSGWSLINPTGSEWEIYGTEGTIHMSGSAFPRRLRATAGSDQVEVEPQPTDESWYCGLARALRDAVSGSDGDSAFATFGDGLRLQRLLDRITEPTV